MACSGCLESCRRAGRSSSDWTSLHLASRGANSDFTRAFRRKNELRIPRGWIYYLAPEIVRRMSPELDEDQLPFSKAADVYAFGYVCVWFEVELAFQKITLALKINTSQSIW